MRSQIADALATESCWPTMMRASPSNPAGRRRSGGAPATSCTCRMVAHLRRSARTPARMSASVAMIRAAAAVRDLLSAAGDPGALRTRMPALDFDWLDWARDLVRARAMRGVAMRCVRPLLVAALLAGACRCSCGPALGTSAWAAGGDRHLFQQAARVRAELPDRPVQAAGAAERGRAGVGLARRQRAAAGGRAPQRRRHERSRTTASSCWSRATPAPPSTMRRCATPGSCSPARARAPSSTSA